MNLFRSLAFIPLAIVATSFTAMASPSLLTLSSSDEKSIRELEVKSWVAWKAHDAGFFEDFLSEDHVEVHGYGIVGKAAVVNGVRNPACIVQSYALGPLSLAPVSADTVLVTYRAEQNSTCGEARVPSPVWATSLYAKRNGKWVNVLYQHTPTVRDAR